MPFALGPLAILELALRPPVGRKLSRPPCYRGDLPKLGDVLNRPR